MSAPPNATLAIIKTAMKRKSFFTNAVCLDYKYTSFIEEHLKKEKVTVIQIPKFLPYGFPFFHLFHKSQTASNIAAIPCPTPMHIVAIPRFAFRRRIS